MEQIKKFFLKIYIYIDLMLMRFGIALKNSEDNVFQAKDKDDDGSSTTIRQTHKNPVIEKMLQGQRDEQYVQDYYEILRKADKFLMNASKEKIEMAADKHGMNLGKKDKWGRRYDHAGFYDPTHKNYGKTMKEALKDEVERARVKDDDYQVEFIFDNSPIKKSLSESLKEDIGDGLEITDTRKRRFPMTIHRDEEVVNKIEMITKYLHIKNVGMDRKILEFFIPKKFKLKDHLDNEEIMNDLKNMKTVHIKDEYDGRYSYSIVEYLKFIDLDNHYDILKFSADKIKNIN